MVSWRKRELIQHGAKTFQGKQLEQHLELLFELKLEPGTNQLRIKLFRRCA